MQKTKFFKKIACIILIVFAVMLPMTVNAFEDINPQNYEGRGAVWSSEVGTPAAEGIKIAKDMCQYLYVFIIIIGIFFCLFGIAKFVIAHANGVGAEQRIAIMSITIGIVLFIIPALTDGIANWDQRIENANQIETEQRSSDELQQEVAGISEADQIEQERTRTEDNIRTTEEKNDFANASKKTAEAGIQAIRDIMKYPIIFLVVIGVLVCLFSIVNLAIAHAELDGPSVRKATEGIAIGVILLLMPLVINNVINWEDLINKESGYTQTVIVRTNVASVEDDMPDAIGGQTAAAAEAWKTAVGQTQSLSKEETILRMIHLWGLDENKDFNTVMEIYDTLSPEEQSLVQSVNINGMSEEDLQRSEEITGQVHDKVSALVGAVVEQRGEALSALQEAMENEKIFTPNATGGLKDQDGNVIMTPEDLINYLTTNNYSLDSVLREMRAKENLKTNREELITSGTEAIQGFFSALGIVCVVAGIVLTLVNIIKLAVAHTDASGAEQQQAAIGLAVGIILLLMPIILTNVVNWQSMVNSAVLDASDLREENPVLDELQNQNSEATPN